MKKLVLLPLVLIAAPVAAKDAPPAPTTMPDLAAVRATAERSIRVSMVDPESTKIEWTDGFRWDSVRYGGFDSKHYGWLACVSVNSKNRMGGYVGAKPYHVLVDAAGKIMNIDWEPSCSTKTALQPELVVTISTAMVGSMADEIGKLAVLRDRGFITPAEFDAQKAKLLSR